MDHQHSLLGLDERLQSWQKVLPYALLLSVTFALYGPSLYFGFVWDDIHYVLENEPIQGLSPSHLRTIWTTPFFGQYAPLHNSLLAVLYFFSGVKPFGYHLGQLLLHAACVCWLYFVLKKIESARVALLASLLFAAYPPNIETVAWISEIKSTLAFLFFLLSFRFFLRLRERERWLDGVLCAVFLILSILAKINTVVAPALFLLYDYKQGCVWTKKKIRPLAGLFLISVAFILIQLVASGQILRQTGEWLVDAVITNHPLPSSYPSSYYGGALVHFMNLPGFLFFYVRMLVFPHPLSAWHMFPVSEELHWAVGVEWIALAAFLWAVYRSPRDLRFWELWFVVFLLPVLQIIPNATWVADRYLYIPAIGAFVLCGKLFFSVSDRLGTVWLRAGWDAVMTAILLAFLWQGHRHLPVWQSDLKFWIATTKTCPASAYCHNRLGQALYVNGYADLAVKEFFRAVQIRPTPSNLVYLGDAYTDGLEDYKRASLAYRMALQTAAALPPDFWAKLAKVYYLAGDLEQAGRAIEAGRKVHADSAKLLLVTGFLHWKQGNIEEARRAVRRAAVLAGQPSDPSGFVSRYWGKHSDAARLLADLGPL